MRQRARHRADFEPHIEPRLAGPARAPRKPASPHAERRGGPPRSGPATLLPALAADGAYQPLHLSPAQAEDYDGRYEFWDRATETAYMVREPSPGHELPSQKLAALAERIASVRGKPIRCYGAMGLALRGKDGGLVRIMQADQALYLHPERVDLAGQKAMVVGEHDFPDVVLEVDRTTDVRHHKLGIYGAWGLPEVWVDVPDEAPRPRAPRGTTIYLLQGDAYEAAEESRAFPGWTAAEIHAALNEEWLSERTVATLERLGALLGQRAGTGPEDDPLLRSQRRQARREAQMEELRHRARLVRHLLIVRGLPVSEGFPMNVAGFAAAAMEDLADAAGRCQDEAGFAARLAR